MQHFNTDLQSFAAAFYIVAVIVRAAGHYSELFNLEPECFAGRVNVNVGFAHPVLLPHIRQELAADVLRLVAHCHLAAVIVPIADHVKPVFFRPWRVLFAHEAGNKKRDARCIGCAAVAGDECFAHREIVWKLADNVLVLVKHPVDNTFWDYPLAEPIALIQERAFPAGPLNIGQPFRCQDRVVLASPVNEPAILNVEHVLDAGITRGRRVQVCDVPAVFRSVCPAKAFLDHAVMQQVDFAEVHASQAHTCYGLVAVCLAAAFPVDLFVTAWQVDQQMCAGIVMARPAGSFEDV